MKDKQPNIILYRTADNHIKIDVLLENENLWLTQKLMADLFECSTDNISLHLKNIFIEGELDTNSVTEYSSVTAADGKKYKTKHYNLDAIIAVGYRVNSYKATQFRIWATKILREYIIKGFVLDDERLKGNKRLGKDYFQELLERIREIRASERRFYQKITDIYAQCSIDYDRNSEITKQFYATVQNKLHWAIHGHTAAELIQERADANKLNMGLMTWKSSPDGKIVITDVSIAKNYLEENELKQLNRIVSMYLDYAEDQAEREIPLTMQDWAKKLDAFLQFNGREILKDPGRVSAELAKEFAEAEFEKYRIIQDEKYVSDFDQELKKYLE